MTLKKCIVKDNLAQIKILNNTGLIKIGQQKKYKAYPMQETLYEKDGSVTFLYCTFKNKWECLRICIFLTKTILK